MALTQILNPHQKAPNDKVLYFAYGSNMDRERLEKERGITILGEEIGILKGYKLVFNKLAGREGEGYANIEDSPSDFVIGVIYTIKEKDIEKLDRYEGVPNHYLRKEILVEDKNKVKKKCFIYIANPDKVRAGLKPSKLYLTYLIEGARQHYFPVEYIKKLEIWETI